MPTATADTATNTAEDTAAASAAAAAAALAQQTQRRLAFLVSFSAGGSAGVVTKTCVQPLERVKNILQIQGASTASGGSGSSMHRATGGGKYNGILDTLRTVVADEGGLALWKGNTANCARIVPAYAVRFATNDSIQLAIAGEGRTVRDLRASELVLAGTLAGVVQQVICYPFETVKARMALAYQTGQNYTSMADCVRTTARHEGWLAIYKGLSASILYGGPYVGAQMTFYELYQRLFMRVCQNSNSDGNKLHHHDAESDAAAAVATPSTFIKLAAGACTGVTAQTLVFPMNTVRTRLQVNGIGGSEKMYTGMVDCIRKTFTREGVRGFFKGCGANNLRMMPNGMIQFAAFDFFKKRFAGLEEKWRRE
jgi:solute carrier family 25 phosphate transporter 23/24/25/41